MTHIIWDWNGTLFDDLSIVVESVNATLEQFGADATAAIDADGYRDKYTRPVHLFYDALLGRRTNEQEWDWLDKTFHDSYRSRLPRGDLVHDARSALDLVVELGLTQSLLSMWWHRELVPMVQKLDVDRYMTRIDGHRGTSSGQTKTSLLEKHLSALSLGGAAGELVVIGDTLDDARRAAATGLQAILYDGGTHHLVELEAARVPVAASLVEAVGLAVRS